MYYSWKLTLVIFATVPVLLTAVAFIGNKMQPNIIKQQERLTQALKFITNSLNSIETVKCFNGQDLELEKYVTKIGEARPWYRRVVNINAQQSAITQFLGSVMFVQGFYYGAILVDDKQKSTAAIITTFMSAVGAFTSLSGILSQMLVVEKGRTAGATLRAVMAHVGSLSSNLENAATEVSPTVERWDIRFEHVRHQCLVPASLLMMYRYPLRILPDRITWRCKMLPSFFLMASSCSLSVVADLGKVLSANSLHTSIHRAAGTSPSMVSLSPS